jgi:hypothetical protein
MLLLFSLIHFWDFVWSKGVVVYVFFSFCSPKTWKLHSNPMWTMSKSWIIIQTQKFVQIFNLTPTYQFYNLVPRAPPSKLSTFRVIWRRWDFSLLDLLFLSPKLYQNTHRSPFPMAKITPKCSSISFSYGQNYTKTLIDLLFLWPKLYQNTHRSPFPMAKIIPKHS